MRAKKLSLKVSNSERTPFSTVRVKQLSKEALLSGAKKVTGGGEEDHGHRQQTGIKPLKHVC